MEKHIKTDWESLIITILRMVIGWHFLYEGIAKVIDGGWSAQSYLANTTGFLSGVYHWIASTPIILQITDILNVYGLILIGFALFVGLFTRFAALCGTLLLTLYYFAYPPFGLSLINVSRESHLYIVDPLIIEAVALIFIFFYKNRGYSIDNLITLLKNKYIKSTDKYHIEPINESQPDNTRREAIKNLASLPVLGLMGWGAGVNTKRYGVDVMSGATVQVNQLDISELKGTLPSGKIGNHTISRMVLGGNLIGGWAHARDLIYVDTLFKAYNNERKVYETLMLAEKVGINTINIGFPSNALLQKYKKATGSKMKVITQIAADTQDESKLYDNLYEAIDYGVDIIQIQGNWCDWMVRDGKIDWIFKLLSRIKEEGFTAGLASHTIDALIACEENGIIPDYYMKTMHHDKYWSAHPIENRVPFEVDGVNHLDHNKFHNNIFCLYPDRTAEFVQRTTVPVMGFKVLAAGALQPQDGFKWAFENGADFICVGMFDFQIVEDTNICIDVLNNLNNRQRPWRG